MSTSAQPGVFFVIKGEKDSGCTVNLKLGEQLHVVLNDSTGREWSGTLTRSIISAVNTGQVRSDGTRIIVFEAVGLGQGTIDLQKSGGSATWKCTVNVK